MKIIKIYFETQLPLNEFQHLSLVSSHLCFKKHQIKSFKNILAIDKGLYPMKYETCDEEL